ncbi:MAG TPA: carbohydrate ABC transporter permease [Chloroflexota bacterium]|nr:carbohydrate ABC transporter permease [Chloroflexota bacterium]
MSVAGTSVLPRAARGRRAAAAPGALVARALAFGVVGVGALTMLVPFVWMVSTSLKAPGEVFLYPPRWIPAQLHWENYRDALTALPFGAWYWNTTYIAVVSTVGQVASAMVVGYAFARLRAPGRDALFVLLLATMMLPEQVTMVPVFLIFKALGWVDTWSPLIVPSWLGGSPFYVFLARQFLMTLPIELDDAARIDGCGVLGVLGRILLPLSKPVIATIAVFTLVAKWNEFLYPVIYLNSTPKYVLSIGLRLFRDLDATSWHWLMAASLVTMIPCLVAFFAAQRLFVRGIATTGLKG